MIEVTRLNGSSLIINAELIETIEGTPDAVIMLTSGKKWVVAETPQQLIEKVIAYKRQCYPDIKELYRES